MEHDMQPANRSCVTWIAKTDATRGASLTLRAKHGSRRSLAALPAAVALASAIVAAALALSAPAAMAAGDAPSSAAPAAEAPTTQQDQGQKTGNFLKNMMKTGAKAPDAWCQRDATQRVLTQAKAVPQSPNAGAGAALMAATPDDCNPEFARLLGACVNDPGHAAPPPRDASLSDRTRLCLAHLAEAGVKASR